MTQASQNLQKISDSNYIYSKKISDVCRFKEFRGKRCFLIGGGESLRSFDFDKIKEEYTIGINKSFLHFPSNFLYLSDASFYSKIQADPDLVSKWREFKGIKVMPSPQIENMMVDCYTIRRNNKYTLPSSFKDGINPGNNSGYGALMLAISLGFSVIYLLGYDFHCHSSTHWHEGYEKQTLDYQNMKLHTFLTPFLLSAADIKRSESTVINLNKKSALSCFIKKEFESVI